MFQNIDPAGQQVSPVTRVQVWFAEQPLLTKAILVLCLCIYAVQVLSGYDNYGLVCLAAKAITADWQVYRLLTSAFVHGGLLHVAFNMLAFMPIGTSLERIQGTLALSHLITLLIFVGGAAYTTFATAASYIPWSIATRVAYQCAIGFSGVVFGLIVVDNSLTGATQRSIFGLFYVPAPLYPWTLLVIWQLIMPGVSFLGHLCGVLIGQLYVWGLLRWLTPSSSLLQSMESSSWLHWLYSKPMYIANTGGATGGLPITRPPSFAISESEGRSFSSIVQQVRTWLSHWLQGGWSRVPTLDPDGPTALGDPLIPEPLPSSSQPQQASAGQRTGDGASPRTAAAAAAQARQARFEASQKPQAPS
ncbi:hypothetical protein ABBQ32_006410 [Trebouxia sp. C0010 RCD-2024]